MRTCLLLPLALFLASGTAAGQDPAARGEAFAGAGVARVGGDEGSLGNGPCFVGGVGFRFSARASVEVDVMRAQHDRIIAGGPLEGSATGVFGNVVYHLSGGRVQAFVMGSAGFLASRTTHTFPIDGRSTTFTSADDGFAWGGGGGAKIFLTPHVSLRPQVRLVFSEATGVSGLATGSVAIGYHW